MGDNYAVSNMRYQNNQKSVQFNVTVIAYLFL